MANPFNKTKGIKARARIRTTLTRLTTLKPPFLDKIEQDSRQATKAILFNKFRFKTPTSKYRIKKMANPINKTKGKKARDRIRTTLSRLTTIQMPYLDNIVQHSIQATTANLVNKFRYKTPASKDRIHQMCLPSNKTRDRVWTAIVRLTSLKQPFLNTIAQHSIKATTAILVNKFRYKTPASKDRIH